MKTLIIEHNRYYDSVFLMRISAELELLDGVDQAVVAMATLVNVQNIEKSGFELNSNIEPSDLLIALETASEQVVETSRRKLDQLLAGAPAEKESTAHRVASLDEALNADDEANLALISVPGTYAAREARMALRRGLHVMLFSDNVSIEDEISLKKEAVARGLLMMGPDCGTAILNGSPLGFANVCRHGGIGIVGASGTGIQEVSSLVHQLGGGISQAIGTGGRDLSDQVDARMTQFAIAALGRDPETQVIVVVSKAPATCVVASILEALRETRKPGIVQFVGWDPEKADPAWLDTGARFAETLQEAASIAVQEIGVELATAPDLPPVQTMRTSRALLGLFCGGTLCQETWSILDQAGIDVISNVAFAPEKKASPDMTSSGHAVWDLGDDVFTVGKPHPMIEPSLRDAKVAASGQDPSIGLILVDCVIGYGAHPNPAQSLADAGRAAYEAAKAEGREFAVLASVTGTDEDPQQRTQQRHILEAAGIIVLPSNADVARTAVHMLKGEGQ